MPEGDTIAYAARRMRPVLVGMVSELQTPHPRFGADGWPERGRAGRPCPRCGERVRSRGQGDDNRVTYWCPRCQA